MEQSQYIRANKGFSFLCVPREFCAAVVLLWGINPASFLYNWAIYAGVVLLWACFAAASEWKRFWKTVFHPAMLLSLAWPVLLFVYALAGHVEFPFHHLLMPIFYLLFWFYVSLPDRFAMKLLTFVTTAYYLLINAGTVLALRQNPDVSRLLANGDPTVTGPLASPFTGGFQHIYSLTMFTVAVVGILWYYRPRIFETVGWGIAVLLGLLTIVMSNYSFAILFVFAFSLLVLCRLPKRGGPTAAILLLCALAAIVVVPNLYRIFYFIAENTDSLKMQLRFIEVGNLLSGTGITEGSDAGTRIELYTASLKTFLSAPAVRRRGFDSQDRRGPALDCRRALDYLRLPGLLRACGQHPVPQHPDCQLLPHRKTAGPPGKIFVPGRLCVILCADHRQRRLQRAAH